MYKRIAIVFFAFCLVLGLLAARLVIITESQSSSAAYTSNSISAVIAQSRGYIYDCNLQPLVNCESELKIAVRPSLSGLAQVSQYIADDDKDYAYIEVKSGRIAVADAKSDADNINSKTVSAVNRYSDDGLCVHLVGYVDVDSQGVCGIEKYYNTILKNNSGKLKARCAVDALGNVLDGVAVSCESVNYDSKGGVALTINKKIQQICENALVQFNITKGAVVVLDAKTSEIRAMASVPEFNQNNVSQSLDDINSPFVNRAITPYSVGSVYKVVVAAAALESGIPTSTRFNCCGYAQVGITQFGCHKETGHGTLDMFGGMAQSCNPYFINLALLTGKDAICDMSNNLGLGNKIELCDGWYSPSGLMPESRSLVSNQDIANIAFGQGELLASPLQMAAVYAAIANNGIYRAPSLMQSVIDSNRVETMRAELPVARRVMSVETAGTVQQLLLSTVENGSGNKAKPENISVAGKTATAQSGQFNESGEEITQSWFCGFFPYEDPQYAVAILKENGEGGSADCAPVFRIIAEGIMTQ